MRIAMFNDNFYPEMSGISDSIIDCSKELAKLGHQVDIYVPKYTKKDYSISKFPEQELELGEKIKIYRFASVHAPAGTGQGRMVVPNFLRWLSMKKNKPDIIHTHLFYGVGLESLAASRFLKVPLVGTSHTPVTEFLHYGPLQNRLIDRTFLSYVSWFYNNCAFVSAPCGAIFTEMKANNFKKPSRVISNPVDLKNFYPAASAEEKAAIKKEFELSDFTVLYTGRLALEKHIDVLIRAIAIAKEKIPYINFAITGHGAAEKTLKALAKELGIADQVKFFGTLPVGEHAQIYKAADVFAIASTAEMQSLSLMKAMATGLPVIGVNAWALPEYIDEKNGFILEPGDHQGIAEKIVFLHENPSRAREFGANGLGMVREFEPEKIARKWEMIYKEVSLNHRNKNK